MSWIGCRKASIGPARIYVDGVFVEEIRNYEPVPIEGYQHTIFRADGLANGTHTLMIKAATSGSLVVVDAFDVRPRSTAAVMTVAPVLDFDKRFGVAFN